MGRWKGLLASQESRANPSNALGFLNEGKHSAGILNAASSASFTKVMLSYNSASRLGTGGSPLLPDNCSITEVFALLWSEVMIDLCEPGSTRHSDLMFATCRF